MPSALVVAADLDRRAGVITALEPALRSTAADGGLDGLNRLNELEVDCVVVDAELPDMPVVGFVSRVRERDPTLPVLVVGGADDPALTSRALRAGAFAHVGSADQLVEPAERAVAARRADAAEDRRRRLLRGFRSVSRALAAGPAAAEIEEVVYERLVETDLYQVVGFGDYSPADGEFTMSRPVPATFPSTDVMGEADIDHVLEPALAAGDVVVADSLWLKTAIVPLGHAETVYGVVLLASTHEFAFGSSERDVLADLGAVVGRAYATAGDRAPGRRTAVENLVHELRNPLGIALAHLEVGREVDDAGSLERVEDALHQIESLIEDFSKVAPVDGIEVATPVDLGEVATRAWEALDGAAATLVVEGTAPVEADAALLERLLSNLFRNAVRHGGDDVTVRVGLVAEGFFVEDDGVGIPESARERVFERGYSGGEGTGIGLSLVTDVVEVHGWSIDLVESGTGGARFEITGVERGDDGRRTGR